MLVLFSRKRTRYMVCEDYCSVGYLGGRGVAISPPAALLGLVRGMGLARRCSGCPRGLQLEGAGRGRLSLAQISGCVVLFG